MSPDLILGIWLGVCVALLVFVKVVLWAIRAAGRVFMSWVIQALP